MNGAGAPSDGWGLGLGRINGRGRDADGRGARVRSDEWGQGAECQVVGGREGWWGIEASFC